MIIICPYCKADFTDDEFNGKYCPICERNIKKFISTIDDFDMYNTYEMDSINDEIGYDETMETPYNL